MSIKKYFSVIFIAFFVGFAFILDATPLNLPIQKIGKTDFYIYNVTQKETIYGICKKLNISKDEILRYNPQLADGLKKGQKLFFPVNDFSTNDTKQKLDKQVPKTFNHLVQRNETLYGISKMYNLSQEEIIKLNPNVINGIKSGEVLVLPQNTNESVSNSKISNNQPAKSTIIFHTIRKGDTLFSLANKYNTSIEEILKLNPGISPTNFQIDNVIRIKTNTIDASNKLKPTDAKFITHKVKSDDSFLSIASSYGVTESELRQANPDVKKLKKNSIIYIPVIKHNDASLTADQQAKKIKIVYDSINNVNKKSINIAVVLPFMLNNEQLDKQANLYTDFYKGLLIAVNDLKSKYTKKINVSIYDSEDSKEKVEEIIKLPEFKNIDLIFAPDDAFQLDVLSKFAKENNSKIVNSFSLKSEDYKNNPNFFQINIPGDYMESRLFEEFDKQFQETEIIFISVGGNNEKEIVSDLKKHLKEKNYITHNLHVSHQMQSSTIEQLIQTGGKYLIIPTSSNLSALKKLLPAVKAIKDDRIDAQIEMFGFPEWSVYTNNFKDFKHIGTYIYSRFYTNHNSWDYKNFDSKFRRFYKKDIVKSAPVFAVLGYDIGKYFITQLGANGNAFGNNVPQFDGIQSNFRFKRLNNWSGLVNDALIFIHFAPNKIEKFSK